MFLTGPVVALPAGTVLTVGGREMVLARCAVRDASRINLGFDGVDSREAAAPLAGLDIALSRGAALAIGGFLFVAHLVGAQLGDSSLNPARSFGPALVEAFMGSPAALRLLWIFVAAPLLGGVLGWQLCVLLYNERPQ